MILTIIIWQHSIQNTISRCTSDEVQCGEWMETRLAPPANNLSRPNSNSSQSKVAGRRMGSRFAMRETSLFGSVLYSVGGPSGLFGRWVVSCLPDTKGYCIPMLSKYWNCGRNITWIDGFRVTMVMKSRKKVRRWFSILLSTWLTFVGQMSFQTKRPTLANALPPMTETRTTTTTTIKMKMMLMKARVRAHLPSRQSLAVISVRH